MVCWPSAGCVPRIVWSRGKPDMKTFQPPIYRTTVIDWESYENFSWIMSALSRTVVAGDVSPDPGALWDPSKRFWTKVTRQICIQPTWRFSAGESSDLRLTSALVSVNRSTHTHRRALSWSSGPELEDKRHGYSRQLDRRAWCYRPEC